MLPMQLLRAATPALLLVLAQQLGFAVALAGRDAARSPVEKVVNLLKDMKERLTEDQAKEQMVYDKYACWCEKTTARKAKAIEDAKNDLRSLGQEILIQRGRVASLTSEIKKTTEDIKQNEKDQEMATAIRQKENAAYMAETGELKEASAALEKAIIVLRGVQGSASAALLQKGFMSSERGLAEAGRAVVAVARVQELASSAPSTALAKLMKSSKHGGPAARLALLRNYAQELASGKAKYTPQSATITGILDEMYSTFTEDLQGRISDEADQNRNFEDLIAVKQEALLEFQEGLKKAEKNKAEAEVMLAEASQAYDDTEAQLKADLAFFDVTKDACEAKTDEWGTRKGLREQELEGIKKALEILTSDEARELFNKAIKDGKATPGKAAASFLQVSDERAAAGRSAPAKKAYEVLAGQAKRAHSLRLARVAAMVKLAKVGHFDEVIKAIDTLIQELQDEESADIAKRDECKEEYKNINSTISDLDWKIEVNQATIDKLTKRIKELEDEKTQTIEDIKDIKKEIKDMKDTRKGENDDFLAAKKDDEDAIKLLKQAKDVMAEFYKKNEIELGKTQGGEGGSLLQRGPEFERHEDEAPDATFTGKGHRKGEAKGIISILTMLVEELGDEITVAQKQEEAAQLLHEKQLKVAEDLQDKLEKKEIHLKKAISARKDDKGKEEKTKEDNEKDLKAEEDYLKEIKPDCDFAIDKFAGRRDARRAEADGLRQAKEFLAGYQEGKGEEGAAAMLQAPAAALLGMERRQISQHRPAA